VFRPTKKSTSSTKVSRLKKIILITVKVIVLPLFCYAQSYTLSPGDSVIASAPFGYFSAFNIQQNNNTANTISVSWEKVSAVLPPSWTALICDNSICYPDLHQSGIMDPILPTGYGILSLHITPQVNPGTAVIQYAVWETSNPAIKDTLTWVINSSPTGISEIQQNQICILLSESTLQINNNKFFNQLRLIDLNGKVAEEYSIGSEEKQFDVSGFSPGIYFVEAKGSQGNFVKKVRIP